MEVRYYWPTQPLLWVLGCQRQGTHTCPVLWSFLSGSDHTGVLHLWCWATTSQSDSTKQELPPGMQGTWINEANCFKGTTTTFSKLWLTTLNWGKCTFTFCIGTAGYLTLNVNCTCPSIHIVYQCYIQFPTCFNKSTLLRIISCTLSNIMYVHTLCEVYTVLKKKKNPTSYTVRAQIRKVTAQYHRSHSSTICASRQKWLFTFSKHTYLYTPTSKLGKSVKYTQCAKSTHLTNSAVKNTAKNCLQIKITKSN